MASLLGRPEVWALEIDVCHALRNQMDVRVGHFEPDDGLAHALAQHGLFDGQRHR